MPSDTPEAEPASTSATGRPRSRPLTWPVVAAATMVALLAAALVYTVLDDGTAGSDTAGDTLDLTPADDVPTGDPLEIAFTFPDGEEATLAATLEGPAVVNFFASWCTPCRREMPAFQEVSAELDGRVQFFGLAMQDRLEDAEAFVDDTGVTYPWARDARGDILGAAGGVQMPTTMFVTADGEVASVHAGAVDADRLRELIAEHLGTGAGDTGSGDTGG